MIVAYTWSSLIGLIWAGNASKRLLVQTRKTNEARESILIRYMYVGFGKRSVESRMWTNFILPLEKYHNSSKWKSNLNVSSRSTWVALIGQWSPYWRGIHTQTHTDTHRHTQTHTDTHLFIRPPVNLSLHSLALPQVNQVKSLIHSFVHSVSQSISQLIIHSVIHLVSQLIDRPITSMPKKVALLWLL